ncbi:FACT complex subunit spt16 [Quaeritorhiza haematococci]|nr:FACT complex subunit spt16 [Quaeritorhiza haematococci]
MEHNPRAQASFVVIAKTATVYLTFSLVPSNSIITPLLLHSLDTKGHAKGATSDDFGNADFLSIVVGNASEEMSYFKSTALQTWLTGYEFPDTIIVITPEKFVFLTSQRKAAILEGLKRDDGRVQIEILKRTKDEAANKEVFQQLINIMASSKDGKKAGVLVKDKFEGKFINEWKKALADSGKEFQDVDISHGAAFVLASKDEEEFRNVRAASRLTAMVMKKYVIDQIESILDEEKKITHEQFSQDVETCIQQETNKSKLGFPKDVSLEFSDWCYPPIIQSGGKYDLRPSAMCNTDHLHAGTIICSLGVRYKNYCSNIARTFLIDPEKSKEKNYKFLVELFDHAISFIKEGVSCKDVYQRVVAYIEKKRPDLKDHFVKNIGFGMGLEFKESSYTLSPKHPRELRAGMIINLALGFQNLESPNKKDEKEKNYALFIADSIRITPDGSSSMNLTADVTKDLSEISYMFNEEDGDGAEASDDEKQASASGSRRNSKEDGVDSGKAAADRKAVVGGDRIKKIDSKGKENEGTSSPKTTAPSKKTAVLSSKLRGEERDEMSAEQRRRLHQKQLAQSKQAEGMARFGQAGEGVADKSKQVVFKKYESYRKESQLPRETRDLKIIVDKRNDTIILPIYGLAVPFHISTLKNVSKSDEGDYVYLRFNFITPGQSAGKKEPGVSPFEDPNATFIRSISFRSADVHRFTEIFREINDLKKSMQKREAERKEMADLVVQDKLVEVKGRRPPRLPDVFCRPQLEGKRFPGDLEIHSNGLRYVSNLRSDQKIDVVFPNIKHLFFQPCTSELVIILHIHLRNPIMIGKKKTRDIQIYREVVDASFDETGNRKRRYNYGDEDELMAEQEERRRRAALNKEFKEFAERISEASKGVVEVDVPFRELGFHGVPIPNRQLVLLQPTTDCLVQLTEPPPLVMTLSEIEVAHLERVAFGLKAFDMVFVFKDFSKPVVHINNIPMDQLDNVKEWLDSVDVAFTEGPVNLNWTQIMKTINEDPASFFEEGGWSFLRTESDSENGGDGSDVSDSASEFEMDSDEFEESESEEDSDGYSDASDDDSGSEEEEDESEGEDWDELDRKAAKHDERKREMEQGGGGGSRKRRDDDSDDDRKPKKKMKR